MHLKSTLKSPWLFLKKFNTEKLHPENPLPKLKPWLLNYFGLSQAELGLPLGSSLAKVQKILNSYYEQHQSHRKTWIIPDTIKPELLNQVRKFGIPYSILPSGDFGILERQKTVDFLFEPRPSQQALLLQSPNRFGIEEKWIAEIAKEAHSLGIQVLLETNHTSLVYTSEQMKRLGVDVAFGSLNAFLLTHPDWTCSDFLAVKPHLAQSLENYRANGSSNLDLKWIEPLSDSRLETRNQAIRKYLTSYANHHFQNWEPLYPSLPRDAITLVCHADKNKILGTLSPSDIKLALSEKFGFEEQTNLNDSELDATEWNAWNYEKSYEKVQRREKNASA